MRDAAADLNFEEAARPRKPGSEEVSAEPDSRIYKPKSMRDGGQEFGGIVRPDTTPRSTSGAPGRRGGWKKR
jgi:excinuclease ABC subunit B